MRFVGLLAIVMLRTVAIFSLLSVVAGIEAHAYAGTGDNGLIRIAGICTVVAIFWTLANLAEHAMVVTTKG